MKRNAVDGLFTKPSRTEEPKMRSSHPFRMLCLVAAFSLSLVFAPGSSAKEVQITAPNPQVDYSLRNEVQHAIDRGLRWLAPQQKPEGYWSQAETPALTGLVLTAFMGDPGGSFKSSPAAPVIRKGYDYLLRCIQPDGGIYVKDLSNYNTSVAIMALMVARNPAYEPVIRNARNFIIGLQDLSEKGQTDNLYDGGIGYGGTYKHSDMSNTLYALESLYYTKSLAKDTGEHAVAVKELNWAAAIKFIQRCQNLPGYNDQPWASDDPENRGGFVYFPGDSKAGEEKVPSGKTALRSYGSISYAGLLSYIYADVDRHDPRVKAVFDWLRRNYTVEENPGMGQQGLYYYYHTMAKGLSIYGVDKLALESGKEVNWRKELALKLFNLQKADGSWVNENARWWQNDPVLVTSFAVITLEILYRGL
jgi:squalene-hopene/tetraprenyl-beta-curcumene cyclase